MSTYSQIQMPKLTRCMLGLSSTAEPRHGNNDDVLAMAKLNGYKLQKWRADTLENLLACPNNQIDSLLPFA